MAYKFGHLKVMSDNVPQETKPRSINQTCKSIAEGNWNSLRYLFGRYSMHVDTFIKICLLSLRHSSAYLLTQSP